MKERGKTAREEEKDLVQEPDSRRKRETEKWRERERESERLEQRDRTMKPQRQRETGDSTYCRESELTVVKEWERKSEKTLGAEAEGAERTDRNGPDHLCELLEGHRAVLVNITGAEELVDCLVFHLHVAPFQKLANSVLGEPASVSKFFVQLAIRK